MQEASLFLAKTYLEKDAKILWNLFDVQQLKHIGTKKTDNSPSLSLESASPKGFHFEHKKLTCQRIRNQGDNFRVITADLRTFGR